MAVRKPPARQTRQAPAKKVVPAKRGPAKGDVTQYADKPPTEYHKAFARYIVQVIGYDPNTAASKRAAFLKGVSIGTTARPSFMDSDFIEEWRAETGYAKRGPKAATEEAPKARKRAPEPEEDEDELDDSSDDDEFDDEADDEFDDEDEADAVDDDDDEEEEEPEPPKARRGRPPVKRAPAKKTPGRKAAPVDDDDFVF